MRPFRETKTGRFKVGSFSQIRTTVLNTLGHLEHFHSWQTEQRQECKAQSACCRSGCIELSESKRQIQGLWEQQEAKERERECVSGERAVAARELASAPVDQRPSLSCYLSPSLLSASPHIFFDSITKSPGVMVGEVNQIFCIMCWWQEWRNFTPNTDFWHPRICISVVIKHSTEKSKHVQYKAYGT